MPVGNHRHCCTCTDVVFVRFLLFLCFLFWFVDLQTDAMLFASNMSVGGNQQMMVPMQARTFRVLRKQVPCALTSEGCRGRTSPQESKEIELIGSSGNQLIGLWVTLEIYENICGLWARHLRKPADSSPDAG